MIKNIILNNKTQSTSIKSDNHFKSIRSVDIYSNIPLLEADPKGLRFTLKNNFTSLDCFCWQIKGERSFNCFNILNQFGELNRDSFFNELLISCEGINFSALTEININLEIV